MSDQPATPGPAAASRRTLTVLLLARLVLNLQMRIVYPFLPVIGRGLGVPLETASLLLTVRAFFGASSPLFGFLSDRYGRRVLMLAGLAALVVGCLFAGGFPAFGIALAAFALLGLSKASYDPALQAFIGDTVPYEVRGRVLGLQELAWAGAWLLGVPLSGFLIVQAGWRSPFWGIAALGVIGLIAVWRFCPELRADTRLRRPHASMARETRGLRWLTRSAVLAVIVSALLVVANENVFIVYGAWIETRFGLSVTALGLASIVISLAELTAEGASAGLADRVGKRRAVLGGIVLNVVAYVSLPYIAGTLGGALTGVVLLFFTFEFSIVSLVSVVSELTPTARGTIMALNLAGASIGRVVGSLSGPRLWEAGGISANAIVSAIAVALAGVILWRGVKEGQERAIEGPQIVEDFDAL